MDQTQPNPKTPSLAKTAGKTAVVNAAAAAGTIVGFFAGVMVVGTVADKLSKKYKKTPETAENN